MTTIERPEATAPASSESYQSRWSWDEVRWASHCIDCYPGNCPMRVYVKDGKVMWVDADGRTGDIIGWAR